MITILSKIPKNLIELNISDNNLSSQAFILLADSILTNINYKLQRLILENCNIND